MSSVDRTTRYQARLKARTKQDLNSEEIELLGQSREFDLFFADDSWQRNPSRPEMGPLVSIGGLNVCGTAVGSLIAAIDQACLRAGFPEGEEFKWSPGRELWMHSNLLDNDRQSFFLDVIKQLADHEVVVFVVIRDIACRSATGAGSPEHDVTNMFFERVQHQCEKNHSCGMVVVDRPPGSRAYEDKFLRSCLETLQQGTAYVKMGHIIHNVVSTPSKLSRLLQAADLITGASMAYVAGEFTYSPPIFRELIPLLYNDGKRIGGYGFKLHPAFRYLNLYHWLVGDTHFWRFNLGIPLPREGHLYYQNPFTP